MYSLRGWFVLVVCLTFTMAAFSLDARVVDAGGRTARGPFGDGGLLGDTAPRRDTWVNDHILVAPRHGHALEAIAAAHGLRVKRAVGPSGYGSFTLPSGLDRDTFLARLRRDPRVSDAARDAWVYGTGGEPARLARGPLRTGRARWHLDASNPPPASDLRAVTVAVLDTGVAYEDRVALGVTHRRAPSLAGVTFAAPWDFINADAHPNDDHQHGTHLASLIAAAGEYPGIAPEVTLMPIKVLDAQNVGTELALIDGLAHAVGNGADVINMSLSFGPAYVPSPALVRGLEQASAAGCVLVAAAGNDGGDYVSQPAANPLVIAVGANRPEGVNVYGAAPYSNASPRVDLMAPGGSVDEDRDGDGLLDGVIGETIALGDPSRTGYWLYAGTSQATALVSGAAAHLVAAGYSASQVRVLLQAGAASEAYIRAPWIDGRGRGRLDVSGALSLGRSDRAPESRELYASILGWLTPGPVPESIRPAARVTVLDERLSPVAGVQVVGMFTGAADSTFSCVTDRQGACTARGEPAPATAAPAWVVSVDDVVIEGVSHHPRTALFAGEGIQALVAEMDRAPELAGAVPMFRWRAAKHPVLGMISPGLMLANLGSGISTSPLALIASPAALANATACGSGTFEVEGGASTSLPLRFRASPAPRCDEGPASYEVVHFPEADLTAVVLDATGLGDDFLRLSAVDTFTRLDGWGGAGSPLLDVQPVIVATGLGGGGVAVNAAHGAHLAGTPFGELLERGGWTTPAGTPAASALVAGTEMHIGAARHARLAGSSGRRVGTGARAP